MDLLGSTVRKHGTRGGRDEFSWEKVKDDPSREKYLGNSLYAPVGRWQQGRDLMWYTRDQRDDDNNKDENKNEKGDIINCEDVNDVARERKEVARREKAMLQAVLDRCGNGGGGDGVAVAEVVKAFGNGVVETGELNEEERERRERKEREKRERRERKEERRRIREERRRRREERERRKKGNDRGRNEGERIGKRRWDGERDGERWYRRQRLRLADDS